MGYNLKVMLPVIYDEDDEMSLAWIHDDLINDRLYNDMGRGTFSYFSFWDMHSHEGSFFGKDDPERLKKVAGEWNKEITEELIGELDKIIHFTSPEDVIKYFEENSCNAYRLREALNAYDDHFQYGTDRVVYGKDGCYTIRIPEEVLKDIKEHPEDYAVIEVVYH